MIIVLNAELKWTNRGDKNMMEYGVMFDLDVATEIKVKENGQTMYLDEWLDKEINKRIKAKSLEWNWLKTMVCIHSGLIVGLLSLILMTRGGQ